MKYGVGWRSIVALFLLSAATVIAAPAQTFTTLVDFNGKNGAEPYLGSLVQGTNGILYGTTSGGGINKDGIIFGVTPSGKRTPVYNFGNTYGSSPYGGLELAIDGAFYGTTPLGGANYSGTIYKITAKGELTELYSFCTQRNCADGSSPYAGVVQGVDGNFYGTTFLGGGSSNCGDSGCGTVFRISPVGTLTTIHSFDNTDGANPIGGVVQATDGNFYGTTDGGGTNYSGTVFKITKDGALTTLHSFDNTDGVSPAGGLTLGTDGTFYGTTFEGGTYGYGTIFSITSAGTLATLHNFDNTDGAYPYAAPVQATDGNFYGTTRGGGANGDGVIYSITAGGTLTTIHSFDNADGSSAYGGLLQATDGAFYGTTIYGGDLTCNGRLGCGTVFSLNMSLNPFVSFVLAASKVGQTSGILGQGFTGATSVSFNGASAVFTVVSDTFIKATVPAGATTGYATVTTPSGVLTSNLPFYVIP